ncbi:hypothetical protein HU200_059378 [Digitaria exilis]|uniref:Pentatricopeptide repeat-containing protein n=1 Tax=Digitaria exilis TaxID=1010633 RepID=A0A835ABS6_9POAL|nr:hypothetical protein HU200_059378 [Digitaria exilis]
MYGKCGRLADARTVFASIGVGLRSAVSWTSMINACSENGRPSEALEVFEEMRSAGVKVDEITILAVISACTRLDCAPSLGDWVEQCALENGLSLNTRVANALIHMHGKTGRVTRCCEIFDPMGFRTVVSWTAMIQALAMNGHGVASLVRLVNEGRQLFKSMVEEYGITPWMEHYGSMVDMLCRSGALDEAFEFVLAMPVKPDPV